MKPPARISDIAARAKVAKSSVSNVLNGKSFVTEEIKRRVLKAAEELNYVPNFYASRVTAKGGSNIIGLFLETLGGEYLPYFDELIGSVVRESHKSGRNVLTYFGKSSSDMTSKLRPNREPIDGAILVNPDLGDERVKQISGAEIPCVVIGYPEGIVSNFVKYVDADNKELVSRITREMLSFDDNVVLIDVIGSVSIAKQRDEAFASVEAKGKRKMIVNLTSPDAKAAYEAMGPLLKEGYTSFITASALIAEGCYQAFKEKGVMAGQEVRLFSLGAPYGLHFAPSLSYSCQDYAKIGKEAMKLLVSSLDGGAEKPFSIIKSRIIYKSSFRPQAKIK